ncbi:hypothetical protein QAD02_001049 [Eretmocerus hayati]|uniref:Uncharacterized protein n=1 Tax=Eretmocerus hayati TaxID=131215 RepID=A0ACC2NF19_9HYME|nr:hypothetical protein QAD02_001049 [Eretmocerus hayati]
MCLAKYSTVFGKTYDFDEIDKLMKNDCAIFSGALILRLCLLTVTKTSSLYLIDPGKETSMDVRNCPTRRKSVEDTTTFYTELFGTFIGSGCVPNVTHISTYANRAVTYSLSPIKKGSPIMSSTASIYKLVPKAERQAVHKMIYNRSCDCQACSEDWSNILADNEEFLKSLEAKPCIGQELFDKLEKINKEIKAKHDRVNFPGKKIEEIPPTRLLKNYNIIYSQPIRNFSANELKANIEIAVLTLMCLAKYSTVFGKTYDFDEIDKLMKNDCAIFSGALILRLCLLTVTKRITLDLIDPCEETTVTNTDIKRSTQHRLVEDTSPNFYNELLGTFIGSGCVPNVTHISTYANRAVTYSLSPIKKGSRILCSLVSIYNLVSKTDRQAEYELMYKRSCDCQACSEDWSDILANVEELKKQLNAKPSIGPQLFDKHMQIDEEIKANSNRIDFPDPQLILRSIELVKESWEHFPMPSLMTDPKIVYNLPTRNFQGDELQCCLEASVLILMGLAKYSSIFGKTYDFSEIGKLAADKLAVFSGALILKLFFITNTRKSIMNLVDPCDNANAENKGIPYSLFDRAWYEKPVNSFSVQVFGRLTITGCIPNVKCFLTHSNRCVMCSLSPIKKGSRLVSSGSSIYELATKSDRQALHQSMYQRPCNCPACAEDWLPVLQDRDKFIEIFKAKLSLGKPLYDEINSIDKEIKEKAHKLNFPDPKLLSRAKNLVIDTWEHFPMPSMITVKAVQRIYTLLGAFHTYRDRDLERVASCNT